jgi:hypothetical protein
MIIDKAAIAVLAATSLFWGGVVAYANYDANKAPPSSQEIAREAYAAALKDSERYNRAYSGCMQERPGSEDRADCLWDAQQDYPQGHRLHLQQEILERTGYNVDLGIPNPY